MDIEFKITSDAPHPSLDKDVSPKDSPRRKKRRPSELTCSSNFSTKVLQDAKLKVENKGGIPNVPSSSKGTMNSPSPRPFLKSLTLSSIAYPFKKPLEGTKIEQFIHTPTTPRSDKNAVRGLFVCTLNTTGSKERVALSINSKQQNNESGSKMESSKLPRIDSHMRAKSPLETDSTAVEKVATEDPTISGKTSPESAIKLESLEGSKTQVCSPRTRRTSIPSVPSSKRRNIQDLVKIKKQFSFSSLGSGKSSHSGKSVGKSKISPYMSRSDSSEVSLKSSTDKGFKSRLMKHAHSRPHFVSSLCFTPIKETILSKEELRGKFCYSIRMVRFVVRLSKCLKFYAWNKGQNQQSLEQLNYYSSENAEFTTRKMVFSKTNFSASNVIYVPPWVRYMLSLPPKERHYQELSRMASMLKTLCYFKKNMDKKKLEDLCRHCTYARFEKQRIVIRSGHTSVFAYLLMSGSVFVNIEEQNKNNGKKFIRTAAVLERGSLFGEIGVIHEIPRTATIVARENVECLVIDSETCLRIFPEEINSDFETRFKHMRSSGLFTGWPMKTLQDLCLVSKLLEYSYGVVVDKNTSTSEFVYIVTKGRLEVMYKVRLNSSNEALSDEAVPLTELYKNPPDHRYLPPLPMPSPPLLCAKKMAPVIKGKKPAMVSMDSLFPYDCCDLLSLSRFKPIQHLILVSRGCEVIRIPKLRLQSIPPLKNWKSFLDRVKKTPSYPPDDVLGRLYFEHAQWASYRKLVFQDLLDSKGSFKHLPPIKTPRIAKTKRSVAKITSLKGVDGDGGSHGDGSRVDVSSRAGGRAKKNNYKTCISYKEPLFDDRKHKHRGSCLRDWAKWPPKMTPLDELSPFSKYHAKALAQF